MTTAGGGGGTPPRPPAGKPSRLFLCPPRLPKTKILTKAFATSATTTKRTTETTSKAGNSRKTPLEHVLLRPGMYVGPTERLPPAPCWVLESDVSKFEETGGFAVGKGDAKGTKESSEEGSSDKDDEEGEIAIGSSTTGGLRMVKRNLGLIPALNKIFDEILVNATDNRLRHPKSSTRIDVTIDPGCDDDDSSENPRPPFIRVSNDGKGIPVQIHRKEKMHVPELLFGHLLTGSNFDDGAKRVTGGRHGYGAKLTNIFSKEFTVETADSKKGLKYKQTWRNNMHEAEPPVITELEEGETDCTTVSFVPDLPRLTGNPSCQVIPPEDLAAMRRRVVDAAGCAGGKLTVTLNGQTLPVRSFEGYAHLYRSKISPPLLFQKLNSRWEVGAGLSSNGSFEAVSFVNGMATTRGGTHVNAIVQQIAKRISDHVAKHYPEVEDSVPPGLIKRNLLVFVNALIENPTFDSQMKESLTSNPSGFGSRYGLSERFLKSVVAPEADGGPGIVEEVVRVALGRQQANLLKKVGGSGKSRRQVLSIPKLDDAHLAGTPGGESGKCTLILTEGDSAKALAVAGLEVIGRDTHGVFPLRGKFLNVRDASVDQLTKNAEVKALCAILGLDFDRTYETKGEREGLRYGHVMLMTDQDADGSHIKGLVINFFRHFWPNLLRPPEDDPDETPFLSSFVTPLLKATTKGKRNRETLSFYSAAEYNDWRSKIEESGDIGKWTVKYYKGLGTSTPAEAKEYFAAFDDHHRPFRWRSESDGRLLDMVFEKDRAKDRREWILTEYDESSTCVPDESDGNSVSFEEFVNREMIHFSNADNIRSLPSAVDGLKPSQRKVLYACFKRNLKQEIKVAQLAGYCAEHTAYHHGEASLHSTITGMAQDFVGSNNINLLLPSGQFGTRLAGGKDAASPRYIFTRLTPTARLLFPEADDALLRHREDDGQMIEPEYYCPIIPLLLVNGSQGIGTGWSTFVPPHHPRDVLSYVRDKLDGSTDLPPIRPWARGFTGTIRPKDDGTGYTSVGRAKATSRTTVLIDELPIGRWTSEYKAHLLNMRSKASIQSFVENHTTTSVSFLVTLKSVQLNRMKSHPGLEKAFKLQSNLATTNMNAFTADGVIERFDTPEDIADAYFPIRLGLYHDRKSVLESSMDHSAAVLRNKARFISHVAEGKIDLVGSSRTDAVLHLEELQFETLSDLDARRRNNAVDSRRAKHEDGGSNDGKHDGPPEHPREREFDYLLNMPLSSLTSDKVESLQRDAAKTDEDLDAVRRTLPEDLWRADLEKLEPHLPS